MARVVRYRVLFLMFLPGFAFILIFDYGPLYGLQIAFKDFMILKGVWGTPWIGFKHFEEFFTSIDSLRVLRNTVLISLYRLLFGFPAPILMAVLINEVGNTAYKRTVQTISYLPHFISWVILAGMIGKVLSPSTGVVNGFLKLLGLEPVYFLVKPNWFIVAVITTGIWKEVGWGSIVYLAALAGVDPELYEAAVIDGAGRIQRILRITLPSLTSVVTIMLILSMANILNAGFDQIFNMYNYQVLEVADIIDTFVYNRGLVGMEYSFTTAVGLFKSVVGLLLVLVANAINRRVGRSEYGLF